MSFVELWKKEKEEERERWKQERIIKDGIQKSQKKLILAILKSYGINESDVQTNGYVFRFEYNGLIIDFVNQVERFCGEIYRKPLTQDEIDCIKYAHWIIYTSNKDEKYKKRMFEREFNYKHFCLYGVPSQLHTIINLANEISIHKQDTKNTEEINKVNICKDEILNKSKDNILIRIYKAIKNEI